jgi:zinc protease
MTIPLLQTYEAEADGVPLFWGEVDSPFTAALLFRVGQADESFVKRGITHLVEHLAFSALGSVSYPCNAFVDPMFTGFWARGTREETLGFLTSITNALLELPVARLPLERRVLGTEALTASQGYGRDFLFHRFGLATYGLVATQELGLQWLDEDEVREWATQRFNKSNAAIWMSGAPPSDLRLPLVDGRRWPPVQPESVKDLPLPVYVKRKPGDQTIAISFTAPRNAAHQLLMDVLPKRMTRELRHEQALIYGVEADSMLISLERRHSVLGVHALQEHAEDVQRKFLGILESMSSEGPSPVELSETVEGGRRVLGDRSSLPGVLDFQARDHLLGLPTQPAASLIAELETVRSEDVAALLRDAMPTAIMFVPSNAWAPPGFSQYPQWSSEGVAGRPFVRQPAKPKRWGLSGPPASKEVAYLGAEGISIISPRKNLATVRFDECVGVIKAAGGVRDIWGRDGMRIHIDPSKWVGGDSLVAAIDAALSPDLFVPERTEDPLGPKPLSD